MKISGNQNLPAHGRSRNVQQPKPSASLAAEQRAPLPEAPRPTLDEELAKSVQRVGARIAAAVDTGSLTPRQAQALSEVQQDFEQQMGRLAQAMHEDGVSRHELNDGMSKVYGSLRESLNAILSAGQGQPFEPIALDLHA
jgi:hypothetical protein